MSDELNKLREIVGQLKRNALNRRECCDELPSGPNAALLMAQLEELYAEKLEALLPALEQLRERVHDEICQGAPIVCVYCGHNSATWEDMRFHMPVCQKHPLMMRIRELGERLLESNGLLRSASSIASRQGTQTNWEAFAGQVSKELKLQHQITNELRAALNPTEPK